MQIIALLVDQELGVTNDVDEQNMRDLQVDFSFCVAGHLYFGHCGATSKLCCQLFYAGPRRRFECEHRLQQRFQARWNARRLQLFDGERVGFLRDVNFLNLAASERRLTSERKPERGAE